MHNILVNIPNNDKQNYSISIYIKIIGLIPCLNHPINKSLGTSVIYSPIWPTDQLNYNPAYHNGWTDGRTDIVYYRVSSLLKSR